MNTYEQVAQWNEKAGKKVTSNIGTTAYWKSLADQFNRISEELTELYEAIETKDIKKLVDSGGDLDVTVAGLNYLSGADYPSAINSILSNNDLKINKDKKIVEQWQFYWEANGVECSIVESEVNGETYYSLHRDSDDKILKYAKFPEVDLTPYLPTPIEEKYVLVDGEPSEKAVETGLEILYLADMDDEGEVMANFLDQTESREVVLTILNGDLVNVTSLEEV